MSNRSNSIKNQLIATTQSSKLDTERRLNRLDLNERISKAEAIARKDKYRSTSEKVLLDSFTMLQSDAAAIKEIRYRCLQSRLDVNKSLLIRAGIKILQTMSIEELSKVLNDLPRVRVGRPKTE